MSRPTPDRVASRQSFKAGEAARILAAFDRCVFCGVRHGDVYPSPRANRRAWLEIEHIIPVARGGTNAYDNLTVACKSCNRIKGTKTAAEFGFPCVRTAAEALVGG